MRESVPSRSAGRNIGPAVSAPVSLILLASRASDPDRAPVVLRGDLGELDWLAARRHALQVLDVLLHNEVGGTFSVEIQTVDGMLLFACTGGES